MFIIFQELIVQDWIVLVGRIFFAFLLLLLALQLVSAKVGGVSDVELIYLDESAKVCAFSDFEPIS